MKTHVISERIGCPMISNMIGQGDTIFIGNWPIMTKPSMVLSGRKDPEIRLRNRRWLAQSSLVNQPWASAPIVVKMW